MKLSFAILSAVVAFSTVSCQNGAATNPFAKLFNRSSADADSNGGYATGSWGQTGTTATTAATNSYGYATQNYSPATGAPGWQQAVGNPSRPESYVSSSSSHDSAEVQPFTENGSDTSYETAYTAPAPKVTTTKKPTTTMSSTKVATIKPLKTTTSSSTVSYRPPAKISNTNTTTSRHTVKKGDTLYNISKRYGMSVSELQSINGLNSANIQIGQSLRVN